ncbi:MAG: hypothetical protein WD872_08395 [Pirellulaceae bacterium]
MHNLLPAKKNVLVAAATVLVLALACRGASAREEFQGWNLEPALGQAHLVMVARVASISRVTVVEGAKTDVTLREFRFQPVRVLKGLFQRDELSMTAADLGLSAEQTSVAPPLAEGEFRLLILVQPKGLTSYGCVAAAPGATTFGERVPLLTGPDDPLVGVVETLLQVADSRSRREQAKLLIERLADPNTSGLAAVPLLSSLRLRADWGAADQRAYASLARLARNTQTAVRGGAVEVLRDVLASGVVPDDPGKLDGMADALCELLDSEEANTGVRVAALEALGHLLALKSDLDAPRELLTRELTAAATYAERAAAAAALAEISDHRAVAAFQKAFAGLPLDEPPAREAIYAGAAIRLLTPSDVLPLGDVFSARIALHLRLKRSLDAGQSLAAEADALGRLGNPRSLPPLLAAAGQEGVSRADYHRIAWALGRLGDDQAVPVLIGWLRGSDHQLKELSLAALESIDSPMAAQEARPLLKSEPNLSFKLRIARLLARHGIDDGYALATEHLSDDGHTAAATLVLVALDDPRTANDLSAILASGPDRSWRAAALTGLAAIGDEAARQQLLEILADDRHPLAAEAASAAGLAADAELLLPLATLVRSRNQPLARASLLALRRFFSGVRSSPRGLAAVDLDNVDLDDGELPSPAADVPAQTRAKLTESVASLAVDAYVEADVRREALAVARLLGGENYSKLLSDLADQAELEGTPLLAEVQADRRRWHP